MVANRLTESALDKHNAECDLYRMLDGHRIVAYRVIPERPAHDKAAEIVWREGSGRGAMPTGATNRQPTRRGSRLGFASSWA